MTKMKKQWFAALMAMAAVVGFSACSKSGSSAASGAKDSVIRIASGSPLSGGQAAAGKDFANGAQLAVDEINAKGGIDVAGKKYTLELVPEDDQADPKTGATVAQKIVDDKSIVAVVGHYNSGVTMVANPIYAKGNLASLTVSTNPDVTLKAPKLSDGSTSIFRMDAHDGIQGPALATFAQKNGVKKLAVLDDATAYGKGLGDQVEKKAKELGLDVSLRESATDKTVDFKAILTKIKAAGVDGIMWGGYDDTGAILSKQARELGITAILLMPDTACTDNYIKLADDAGEGAICSSTSVPLDNMANGAAFRANYDKHFPGQVVQAYAPLSYDAVYVVAEAIKLAGAPHDSLKIAAALPKVKFAGLTGTIAFEPNGERLNAEIAILQLKDKVFKVVEILK
ncbi:MAG: braC 2 [Burkholderiaceae bacterium]|nr:braC 2 [Burkholderiaceae bacterium]